MKSFQKKICLLLFWGNTMLYAQNVSPHFYKKQFSFTCDNDFFLLSGSDRYYTNGLFFDYSMLPKRSINKKLKQVNKLQLGQEIFTPYKRKITPGNINELDRPITGYLFFDYSQRKFLNNRRFWGWGITPGLIGPAALGEEVQTSWHRVIGVKSKWDWIWAYQLKNEPGINVHAEYAFNILNGGLSCIQITPITNISLGTLITNAKEGLLFQFGNFNDMDKSEQWGSRISTLQAKEIKKEFYFFYEPSILYQVYNATVQGGLFRSYKGPITGYLNQFVISNELGFTASLRKYTASIKIVYQGKETPSQFDSHIYGSIMAGVRF